MIENLSVDLNNFKYLEKIYKEIVERYKPTSVLVNRKTNNQKIELKINLPIFKSFKIKNNTEETNLHTQIRIIDSLDQKLALRIEFFIYSSYNDCYYLLPLNRKIKITHRGSNFDKEENILDLVEKLPSEKEIRILIENFCERYLVLSKTFLDLKETNFFINSISDSYLRNMFERKLNCSKYFKIKTKNLIKENSNTEIEEEEIKYSLENILNCFFETQRSAPADGLIRSNKKFEKVLKNFFKKS